MHTVSSYKNIEYPIGVKGYRHQFSLVLLFNNFGKESHHNANSNLHISRHLNNKFLLPVASWHLLPAKAKYKD